MRLVPLSVTLVPLLFFGCASSESPLPSRADLSLQPPDARGDVIPGFDVVYPRIGDARGGEAGCTLGSVENCGFCGDRCPPEADTASTARRCAAGRCDIACKEESYDVNGKVEDGCEAMDDLPIHDSAALAVDLGDTSDCQTEPVTATGTIPSDDRQHLKAPADRPNGRADWYKLHISDDFGCITEGQVTVSLAGLPSAATYRVVGHWVCDNANQLEPDARAGNGGTTLILKPPNACSSSGVGDDSGTLYLTITKESGPHSTGSYAVEVAP